MTIMAQIQELERLAEKAADIACITSKCDVRNDPRVYAYQLQRIDEYLRQAEELKKQLNTSNNE